MFVEKIELIYQVAESVDYCRLTREYGADE